VKSFQAQTFYELLEISVAASALDIKSAFERLDRLYSDDQVALYGLVDEASARALRSRLREALDVLMDDGRRADYDATIGLPPRDVPKPKPSAKPPPPAPSQPWAQSYAFVSTQSTAAPVAAGYTYTVSAPVAAQSPIGTDARQGEPPSEPPRPSAPLLQRVADSPSARVAAPPQSERSTEGPVASSAPTNAQPSAATDTSSPPLSARPLDDEEAPATPLDERASGAAEPEGADQVASPAEATSPVDRKEPPAPVTPGAVATSPEAPGATERASPALATELTPPPVTTPRAVTPEPEPPSVTMVPTPPAITTEPAPPAITTEPAPVAEPPPPAVAREPSPVAEPPAPAATREPAPAALPTPPPVAAPPAVTTEPPDPQSTPAPRAAARDEVPSAPPSAPEFSSRDGDAESAIVPTRSFTPREYKPPERPKPYEVPAGVEFNGDLLRQVRMARGLSLLQLSERTRIGVRHLENLENDRYEQLPAMVYLRGMLMSLARELGLDGLRVAKSYLTFVEAHLAKSKG